MPRNAEKLLGKITGGSLESQRSPRPVQRQFSNAVYVYRHPLGLDSSAEADSNWPLSLARELGNATGNRLHPVGSIIRRSPSSSMRVRNGQSTKTLSSNPPSPPLDPTLEAQRSSSPVPTISIAHPSEIAEEEKRTSIPTTGNELMKILMEDDGTDHPVIFTIFEAANIDGVKHLSSKSRCTRYTWFVLIIMFICLCFYQIGAQAMMYWLTPVATNIMAAYPESLPFPVVAICNNNQHRLTYLTGNAMQTRSPHSGAPSSLRRHLNESDVFDRVLLNSWDMEAGSFLRNAAHQKQRMIVHCELPNGSRCSHRDFRPLWTLTGLCWAINTDPDSPMHVTGAGPGNALRLLVNVERYERVESCTPKLRTRSLPGLKVLIVNQTDIPASYLEGVNVPAGFTMDIPFWMRHRQKLAGRDCVVFGSADGSPTNGQTTEREEDLRSCLMRSYLGEIERRCNCSMRQVYLQKTDNNNNEVKFASCNVLKYFECVQPVLQWALNKGFSNFRHCPVPCESIDYTAWQDMTELPSNIFPQLIADRQDEDDEDTSEEDDSSEENNHDLLDRGENGEEIDSDENHQIHYQCVHNQMLNEQHVRRIKRAAQLAFENQAKFQEDIQLRTRRLIAEMRQSVNRLIEMRWSWRPEHFIGVHQRLSRSVSCYDEVPRRHPNVFNALANPKPQGEEDRARQLQKLLAEGRRNASLQSNLRTITDVKRAYGERRAEQAYKEMETMEELIRWMYSLFSADTFTERLPNSLARMDKVLQLMRQYETGNMSKKSWAERMQARNMRHFFDEDFYESWYNLIVKDLEQNVLGRINEIAEVLPTLQKNTANGTTFSTGAVLLFDDVGTQHTTEWAQFMDDALECIFNGIRNASAQMLKEFQRAMLDLQSAQMALFRKELPEYLRNFEFGPKFVQENFAQVNVFLHKMNIERWKQEPTYSIWSFFCDIGATMSLFLGASMLTIIEVLYFVVRNTSLYRSLSVWRQRKISMGVSDEKSQQAQPEQQKNSIMV